MSRLETVARLLCGWAEYTDANWSLYVPKASEILMAIGVPNGPGAVAGNPPLDTAKKEGLDGRWHRAAAGEETQT